MDDELKDRFKALKAIQDYTKEFDEEESKQIREMEVEFEQKYKDVYRQRDAVVSGKEELNKKLIEAFNKRAVQMKDEAYEALEIIPCDVKGI